MQMYRVLTAHYFFLENQLLFKSRQTDEAVEQGRTERVQQNIEAARKEKGLVTIAESVNETDRNQTHMVDKTKNNKLTGQSRDQSEGDKYISKERLN